MLLLFYSKFVLLFLPCQIWMALCIKVLLSLFELLSFSQIFDAVCFSLILLYTLLENFCCCLILNMTGVCTIDKKAFWVTKYKL